MWEFLSTVFQFINLLFNCVQSVMDFMYCTLYLKCDFLLLYNNWFLLIFICSYFIYIYVYLKYFLTLFIDNITSFYTFRLCHFFSFIFISWRPTISQHCSGFCHTLTWISHGVTCIPHPDALSHLPLHLIQNLPPGVSSLSKNWFC